MRCKNKIEKKKESSSMQECMTEKRIKLKKGVTSCRKKIGIIAIVQQNTIKGIKRSKRRKTDNEQKKKSLYRTNKQKYIKC